MALAEDETEQLLRKWCAGDRDALTELVARNASWIHARIRQRRDEALRHLETVDQFQDLMLEVLAFAPRFLVKSRGQFRALLGRMIENDLIDRARAARRRRDLGGQGISESRLSLDPAIPQPTAPASAAARNEELAWLRLGLEFLPEAPRRLVERHALAGRTFVELQDELGDSANTLRMRYNRAIVTLTGIIQRLQRGEVEALDAEADGRTGDRATGREPPGRRP